MTTEEKEKYGPKDPGQKIFPSHFWNASKTPYPFSPMSPSIFLKPHSCSSKRLQPINFCLSLLFLSLHIHRWRGILRMELLNFGRECSFWEPEQLQLNITATHKETFVYTRIDQYK